VTDGTGAGAAFHATIEAMSHTVDAPGHPEVRITAGSGSVTVVAEARADVVAEGDVDIHRSDDGAFEVAPRSRSRSLRVHCPEGSAVMIGTRSGSLRLEGRLGAVRATTISGSIHVAWAATADLRAMSGKITVDRCDGSCRIKTKSGSTGVGAAGAVEITIGSGSVRVDHVDAGARVRAVSGSVHVRAGGNGPLEVETMSGSITIELPAGCRADVRAKSMTSRPRIECERGDDCRVTARTMSGGITVRAG